MALTLAERADCRAAVLCWMWATVAGEADRVGDMRTGVNASGSDLEGLTSATLPPVMQSAASLT